MALYTFLSTVNSLFSQLKAANLKKIFITDTIRLWDVESGQPLQRMSTGRLEKRLETIVWSVLMLNDFTVVSGDSRGKTSFWNSRNGTLLDSYQSHKGDILTVTCNQDQTVIYASGADPTIVHFQSVVTGENKVSFVSDCFFR